MKERVLVETKNVIEANRQLFKLLKRPKTEISGLAVIYGPTGYGKTRWAEITAFKNGWGYMRVNRLQKEKAFVQDIYQHLHWLVYHEEIIARGHASKIENDCIKILQDNPDLVLFIDEINHKIHKREWDILEIIRDLTDRSFATIVMVGEQDTVTALNGYNPHFFARCNFFYKFTKNSFHDVKSIFDEVSEVDIEDKSLLNDVLKQIYAETDGDLRKFVSYIPDIENGEVLVNG